MAVGATMNELRALVLQDLAIKQECWYMAQWSAAAWQRLKHTLPKGFSPYITTTMRSADAAAYYVFYMEDYFPHVKYDLVIDPSQF